MGFDELEQAIAGRLPKLSKRLRQIGSYALAHPGEMAQGTVASLAKRLAVTPSALVRFAQSFGFDGCRDMQRVFRSRRASAPPSQGLRLQRKRRARARLRGQQAALSVLEELVEQDIAALDQLLHSAPDKQMKALTQHLKQAHVVYLVASASSFPVACYFSYALGRWGVPSVLVSGIGGLLGEQLSSASTRDLLFAFELDAFNPTDLQSVARATKRGARLAVLTCNARSALAKLAHVCLVAPRARRGQPRSPAALMTLGVALTVAVGQGTASRIACKSDASPVASWPASHTMMPP
jgi:DNA-binding MurR/RpiR family transcriptional regulator